MLQMIRFTAFEYVLAWLNCSCCLRASGNDMVFSILKIFLPFSHCGHCLEFARLFICALWSPAGKRLTSWLSFVVSNCEFVTFPLIAWVRCGT